MKAYKSRFLFCLGEFIYCNQVMHCYEVAASKIKEEIMYESLCYVLPLICKPGDISLNLKVSSKCLLVHDINKSY